MDLRGICNPVTALTKFTLTRVEPAEALRPFVQHYWIVAWDLDSPHAQRILPYPTVHVTFQREGSRITGVVREHDVQTIEGRSHVFGVRFRPGGFRPFLGAPLSTVTGRVLPLEPVFPQRIRALERALVEATDPHAMALQADAFLTVLAPEAADPRIAAVDGLVAHVARHPGLTRVDTLAADAGLSVRALQRLFNDWIGVGPKWVIRHARIQEAAERARLPGDESTGVDWAGLAADLGYSDQSHFVRDFTRLVGTSPTRYARTDDRAAGEDPGGPAPMSTVD